VHLHKPFFEILGIFLKKPILGFGSPNLPQNPKIGFIMEIVDGRNKQRASKSCGAACATAF
jgi:hypothetical protein